MPDHDQPGAGDWGVIDDRADRFHAAWAAGPVRDWETFLEGLSPQARVAVLVELVMIDLGHRWRRGERALLEAYVARYPELGPASAVPVKLVAEELRARQAAGDAWTPAEYQARFPAQYAQASGGNDTILPPADRVPTPHFPRSSDPPTDATMLPSTAGGAGSNPAAEFEMVRRLGAGAFGEVWLARKRSTGMEKAVKIVTQPADREAARQERQALELIKNFRHPFLLATEDYWVAGNRLHIVMELADGTLRGRLKECRGAGLPGVPAGELVGYVREVADGLEYLHSKKVVHRDIKPDNILLMNGHAKVADFGLARASENAITSMTLAGSPGYMPPEVWGGQGGPASDQYSLAFVYAEARQGAPPLSADNFSELMIAHMDGAFAFSDLVGPAERDVLTRALARLPADRYPSCKAFADDLALAVAEGGGSVAATSRRRSETVALTPVRPRRKPILLAAGVVAGLGVLIGGLIIAVLSGGPTPSTGDTTITPPTGGPIIDPPPPPPPPPSDGPTLPPNAVRPPDAKVLVLANGRRVVDRFDILVNGVPVRFLFVPGGPVPGRPPVAPFYLSREKINENAFNGLTGIVARDLMLPPPPRMNFTHADAAVFARDIGGALPTVDQWDHAAGLFDPGAATAPPGVGPHRPGAGQPHVNAGAPRATTEANADVGPHGHWDLSGNGREWTADPDPATGRVPLRGRSFTYRLPLDYATLSAERARPQASHPDKPSPYTGFRVALPLR